MQAISRFRSIFVLALFSYIRFVLISLFFHTYSHRYILSPAFVLWKPKSKLDSMATAVTFVRCTDTSTRPSFPRNHSWMPAKATTVDETCLERTISTLRRIAIPLDCIMKISFISVCLLLRAREKEIALWACNRYRILQAAYAVPVGRILIGVGSGPQ
jgi:hypothetical protein